MNHLTFFINYGFSYIIIDNDMDIMRGTQAYLRMSRENKAEDELGLFSSRSFHKLPHESYFIF